MKFLLLLGLLVLLAGCKKDCVLNITRQACPGQEAESFRHCDGKKECQEIKKVENQRAFFKRF